MRLGTLKINIILHFAGGIIECHLKMAWLQMKREINWSLNIIRGRCLSDFKSRNVAISESCFYSTFIAVVIKL